MERTTIRAWSRWIELVRCYNDDAWVAAMILDSTDLLPGEQQVMARDAGMVITAKEYGLSQFAFNDLLCLFGLQGKETIGGMVHLTNYRLIFKSHPFNRVRGTHSILLPNVLRMTARFHKLIVDTRVQQYEFIMWSKQPIIDAAKDELSRLDGDGFEMLRIALISHPELAEPSLQTWDTFEIINKMFVWTRRVASFLSFGLLGV